MDHRVSRQISASLAAGDKRSRILTLMHETMKTPGLKSGASFRALEKTIWNPTTGTPEKITFLFVRTGKESLLEKLKSWWNRKGQHALAEQFIRDAFGDALRNVAKSDRIRPNALATAISVDESEAAAYSLAMEQMVRDIQPVLAKKKAASEGKASEAGGTADFFPDSKLDFCSCLGLSRRRSRLDDLDNLSGGFARLLKAISMQPVAGTGAKEQKELIEGARKYCQCWQERWTAQPGLHFNMAKRNPDIATMNILVASFLRHAPAQDGQQMSPGLLDEMARGRRQAAVLSLGSR
jgi:hypothetical protein